MTRASPHLRPTLPAADPATPLVFELAEAIARFAARRQREAEPPSDPEPKPR